jgi:hypothetical protein
VDEFAGVFDRGWRGFRGVGRGARVYELEAEADDRFGAAIGQITQVRIVFQSEFAMDRLYDGLRLGRNPGGIGVEAIPQLAEQRPA